MLLASPTKHLVIHHRWIMYSLFIGLTLGGLPLVYRLARPMNASAWIAAAVAFAAMLSMAFLQPGGADSSSTLLMLFFAGVAGASAMILPGVSGAYLLLLLGQYVPILDAISKAKSGLLGSGDQPRDLSLFLDAMWVIVPVGVGVMIGIAGVSNLLRALLDRFPKPTLGALIGLLLGAVAGLWPYAEFVRPEPGFVYRGQALTEQEIAECRLEYPTRLRAEHPGEAGGGVALIVVGFGITLLVDRLGRMKPAKA